MVIVFIITSTLFLQQGAAVKAVHQITPAEVELYKAAKPVTEYSTEELRAAYPELSHLQFDPDQDRLKDLLANVADRMTKMFQDLPNTASREDVRRFYRNLGFNQEATTNEHYDYLFLARSEGRHMGWDEVRTGHEGKPVLYEDLKGKGLLTAGYAGLGYFFHPQQQSGSRYRYLGRDPSQTGLMHLIAFAQHAESADSLGSITDEGISYPLLYQGLAWVEPETYQIVRMRVGLLAPRSDIGLYRQETEIWFNEVRFNDVKRGVWLPREVVVTIEYKNRIFRNRHRYSNYRLFTVESYEKRERPAAAPLP